MTNASPKTLPEPSQMALTDQRVGRGILGNDTMDLVWRLIGDGAAAEFAVHRSLWRLLTERNAVNVPWFETERLELLAELVKRLSHEPRQPAARGIDGPEAAAALFAHLALLGHEELWIACLNTKNIPLAVVRVGIGSVNSVVAFPSRIYREALAWNAGGIIVCHNHPSGDPSPSGADREFTKRVEEGGLLVGVPVVDSLIIGSEGRLYSFSRRAELRLTQ